MAYRLVLLDLGGVVVDLETDRLINQMSQLLGRSFEDVQAAIYHRDLLLPLELGRISPEAYYEGLKARLRFHWSYARFVSFWNDVVGENAEMADVIRRLSKLHRLTALTNTNVLHLHHIRANFQALGVFHDWVASCDVGLRKPDPEIYRLALQRAGVEADAAVYVDDRLEMIEGGRSVGLTAIRFENASQLTRELRAVGIDI